MAPGGSWVRLLGTIDTAAKPGPSRVFLSFVLPEDLGGEAMRYHHLGNGCPRVRTCASLTASAKGWRMRVFGGSRAVVALQIEKRLLSRVLALQEAFRPGRRFRSWLLLVSLSVVNFGLESRPVDEGTM